MNRVSIRGGSIVLWTKEKGFCFPLYIPKRNRLRIRKVWRLEPYIFPGMAAWADVEDSPGPVPVLFDGVLKVFVTIEQFRQNKQERKEEAMLLRAAKKEARDLRYELSFASKAHYFVTATD